MPSMHSFGRLRVLMWPASQHRQMNPYVGLLHDSLRARGVSVWDFSAWRLITHRPSVVHVHWPEYGAGGSGTFWRLLSLARFFFTLSWCRINRIAVIWTVHNLRPHSESRLGLLCVNLMHNACSGWISLTKAAIPLILRKFPRLCDKPLVVARHGTYLDEYPVSDALVQDLRKRFDIDDQTTVLLLFGVIDTYKSPLELIDAIQTLNRRDVVLIVAGNCRNAELRRLIDLKTSTTTRVKTLLFHLSTKELGSLLSLADGVLLPYSEILNSGSLLLALGAGKSVLVPRSPVFHEVSILAGPGWVIQDDTPASASAIASFLLSLSAPRLPPKLHAFDWTLIAERHFRLYHACVNRLRR
jgi:beta-1,4-mannosyltransferase